MLKYRPPAYIRLPLERIQEQLDKDIPVIYQSHAMLFSTATQAPVSGAGFAVISGNLSVTGSKVGLATGLTTVSDALASINNGAVATNLWVTCRPSLTVTGAIDIYCWKPTGTGDNTPIAATSPVTIHWWATGTASTTG